MKCSRSRCIFVERLPVFFSSNTHTSVESIGSITGITMVLFLCKRLQSGVLIRVVVVGLCILLLGDCLQTERKMKTSGQN